MTDKDLDTPGSGGEKIQIVEFEELYTGLQLVSDIENLQKSLVINCSFIGRIPLIASMGFYNSAGYPNERFAVSMKSQLEKYFPEISQRYGVAYEHCVTHWDLQRNHVTMFTINQCWSNGDNYVFITKNGCIFSAEKGDFDQHGFLSPSLKFAGMVNHAQKSIIECSQDNGKIKYNYKGNFKGTLQGSCFTYVSTNDDGDKSVIYVGNKSYIYKSTFSMLYSDNNITHDEEEAIDLGLGEIVKIALDPKQNFLFIISNDEEGNPNLHILDHKKLFNEGDPIIHEIKTIEGISNILIQSDGNLLLKASDGTVDILHTNLNLLDNDKGGSFEMKKMQVKKGKNQTVKDVLDSIGGLSVSLDTTEVSNEGSEDEKKIIEGIWGGMVEINGVSKTLKELFDDANSEKDIEIVKKAFFQIIKQNEKLNSVPDLLKKIENQINSKKNKIFLDSIFSELEDICEELKTAANLETLFTLKEKLQSIQKKRRGIQAGSSITGIKEKDKELKLLLETVDQQIKDYQEAHKEELEDEIQKNLEIIKSALDDIENAIDISSIYTSSVYKATEDMISHLDKEGQERYKKKLNDLRQNRLKEIKEASNKVKMEKEELIEHQKREVEENINQIKDIIEEVDDIDAIEQFKESDPLVLKTKDLLSKLPSIHANALDLRLEKIFGERIFTLRIRGEEAKGLIQNFDTYGIDTILYYDEDGSEQVEWKIEGKEKPDGKISLVVKLMNGETHEYDKSLYLRDFEKYGDVLITDWSVKFDMDESEFLKYSRLLSKYRKSGKKELELLLNNIRSETDKNKREKLTQQFKEKKAYYKDARYTELLVGRLIKQQKLNPRSKVPPYDPNFIVLDEERDILKSLSARLVDQKQNGGIEILEGGPGLGKTVMCKFLAQVTNREIVRVQCCKMDPNDMFFAPTLKKGETSREPADWIKLMQKPGTIILFDEIDKLNDQCFEKLHSLFDGDRSVHDPHIGKVEANPDCLFLGTRNSYDGMSIPVISRGRIKQINYPGVRNEAFKVSKYTDSSILKKMSYEEFEILYDKYITRAEVPPKNAKERKIYDLIININHILNIFYTLRNLYNDDEHQFVYELSYRDARQIFVDYNTSGDFKKSIEEILIPKARAAVIDSEDKKEQEDIVRRAIEAGM